MRLEPMYTCTFAPTESWNVSLEGPAGVEGQGFLLVEGRAAGRVNARLRAANAPRHRTDGTLTPSFQGALETDDGATILFRWQGYGRAAGDGPRQLLGALTHLTDDGRYSWLNDTVCVVGGEVRPHAGGGFEVVLEVFELVWEPPQSSK